MIDLEAVLADLDGLGAPFLVRGRESADGARDAIWFDAGRLIDPSSGEMRRMVEAHAESRGMPVGRHAASLVFQRYCHRICAVAVAAWLRHDAHLNLRASNTVVRFQGGTPDLIVLTALESVDGHEVEDLLATVVDGHLLPVAAALSAETGPGMGNLWGNIAAGFAGAFRTLSHHHDVRETHRRAAEFLGARSQLQRGGDFRLLDGPKGERLQYDRKSCCHWYAAPDGAYCSWCSRLCAEERTRRFLENMSRE